MKWYKQLHWQIIVGLILGLIFGSAAAAWGFGGFVEDWIAPWGTIFLRLLKLIAVPLVLTSLITGVASLSDVKKLSRMGGKTIAIYVGTTAVAVVIGLLVVNIVNPGEKLAPETREKLAEDYKEVADARADTRHMTTRAPHWVEARCSACGPSPDTEYYYYCFILLSK